MASRADYDLPPRYPQVDGCGPRPLLRNGNSPSSGAFSKRRRNPTIRELEGLLDGLASLRHEILIDLEELIKTENMSGNPHVNERHIQNSETESIIEFELGAEQSVDEPSHGKTCRETVARGKITFDRTGSKSDYKTGTEPGELQKSQKSFPLGLVLKACPQIIDYGPSGEIKSWRGLITASVVVRSMMGITPSAFQDAVSVFGPENASALMACILERGEQINSAGGYMRDLTQRGGRGEFSLGPMLMASLRSHGQTKSKAN